MKAIIQSYTPQECERIINGQQTIKVCKTAPKDTPFKVYIYCTNPKIMGELIMCKSAENSKLFGQGSVIGINKGFRKAEDKLLSGKVIGEYVCEKREKMHDIGRRVYSPDGLAPTQHTCGGGNLETKIVVAVDEQNKALRTDGTVGTLTTDGSSPKHNNRVLEGTLKAQMCEQLIASGAVVENDVIRHSYTRSRMKGEMRDIQQNNMSPTIDTRADCLGVVRNFRIRKLTPTECFTLQGVKPADIKLIQPNQSNSSQYHLAGDSICCSVLVAIFAKMFGKDSTQAVNDYLKDIFGGENGREQTPLSCELETNKSRAETRRKK